MTLALALLSTLAVQVAPAAPPPALKPWIDYASALYPDPHDGCPPDMPCVQLSRAELSGRVESGEVTLVLAGSNLGKRSHTSFLLGPAASVSLHSPHFSQGRGQVHLGEQGWWEAEVAPGPFVLHVSVNFVPGPSVALELPPAVAQVVDHVTGGRVVYDESSGQHGGPVFLQARGSASAQEHPEPVSMRTSRRLRYGGVVTFTYVFQVSGLRAQTRLELPMLGDEGVESVDPPVPYSAASDHVAVTLAPSNTTVTMTGHFNSVPTELHKPAGQPYEIWLVAADARHPMQIVSDGMEIDPSEVKVPDVPTDGRAFLLQGSQHLKLSPVAVNVEPGRQGVGQMAVTYVQGERDSWIAELQLTFSTAPNTDRLVVPTPAPPHYAERNHAPLRLFGDPEALSLRVEDTAPIRVQWREKRAASSVFSWMRVNIPGQNVHLDETEAQVAFQPGYVPLAVLGAEHASGDLLEGLELYGVLVGLLGVALAQAARLPRWATAVVGVLLVGLYSVEQFPRWQLLLMLAGCAVIVRLPTSALQGLRGRRRTHAFLAAIWLLVGMGVLGPSVEYASDRLLSALHPWHEASPMPAAGLEGALQPSAPGGGGAADEAETDRREAALPALAAAGGSAYKAGKPAPLQASEALSRLTKSPAAAPPPVAEKTVRAVAFDTPGLPASLLRYRVGALLPGEACKVTVLLVGPLLRAVWMLAETAGVAVMLGFLALRSRRLWRPEAPL